VPLLQNESRKNMPPINRHADQIRPLDRARGGGTPCPDRRDRNDRVIVYGLVLLGASLAPGCGGSNEPTVTPEQKAKQEVVQDKMKGFMKEQKLPNRPR
jgi:hypothetical protein